MGDQEEARLVGPSWLVGHLRATVFPYRLEDIERGLDWEGLTGEAPASVEQQPRLKTTASKGPFAAGELIHARYPDRTELVYTAKLEEGTVEGLALPTLGTIQASLSVFLAVLEKWLGSLPALTRIAFGPVMVMPVTSHAEAYERLQSLLPFVKLDVGTSDFSYQINRPRDSRTVSGVRINRLSRWGAIRLAGHIHVGTKAPILMSESFACRLELDINTHQDFGGELPRESLTHLFRELVDFSEEIAERGDIQ